MWHFGLCLCIFQGNRGRTVWGYRGERVLQWGRRQVNTSRFSRGPSSSSSPPYVSLPQSSSSPVLPWAHKHFWHSAFFVFLWRCSHQLWWIPLWLLGTELQSRLSLFFIFFWNRVRIYRQMETKCPHAHAVTPSGGRPKSIWLWRRAVEAREKERWGLKH